MIKALVNGVPQTTVSVTDRGLAYGDGLFETLRLEQGRPLLLQRHLQRLRLGLERLAIGFDQTFLTVLEAELKQLASDHADGILKLIVTRGQGGRGYRYQAGLEPNRIITLNPSPDYPDSWYQQGVELYRCQTRLGCNPQLAGIKHLNRLEQVLARSEWQDQYPEGLLQDSRGQLIEGTMSNLFLVHQGRLLTPALDQSGVAGVVRSVIIDQARSHQVEVAEQALTFDDLHRADGAFITNTGFGVLPVIGCDGHCMSMQPITAQAQGWLQEARRCEF